MVACTHSLESAFPGSTEAILAALWDHTRFAPRMAKARASEPRLFAIRGRNMPRACRMRRVKDRDAGRECRRLQVLRETRLYVDVNVIPDAYPGWPGEIEVYLASKAVERGFDYTAILHIFDSGAVLHAQMY